MRSSVVCVFVDSVKGGNANPSQVCAFLSSSVLQCQHREIGQVVV